MIDDPELRSDETVLVRTQGIYVKSIPFEGILTDKRIILVDRAKNLLPPKEIPLSTIKEVQPGENAIRDQIMTLSVVANKGVTRQVILTFSRESIGNRTKERDEWIRLIRDYSSTSFGQQIRKAISGTEPAQKKAEDATSPRIEIVGSPIVSHPAAKKEMDTIHPEKKSIERATPVSPQPEVPLADSPALSFGTFCTRCGNRVPEGSEFCNRCGTKIVISGEISPVSSAPQIPVSQPAPTYTVPGKKERPLDREIQSIEPLIERSAIKIPHDPLRGFHPPEPQPTIQPTPPSVVSQPEVSQQETPAITPAGLPETPQPLPETPSPVLSQTKPSPRRFIPRLFSPKDLPPAPLVPGSMPTATHPVPQKPPRRNGMFIAIGVIVIILIAVVAGVVIFLKPGTGAGNGAITPFTSGTVEPSGTTTVRITAAPAVTIVRPEQTPAVIPATGVYVHVNYLGGWKGTYGPLDTSQQVTNSGERLYEVENATGTVQASFWKLDGSAHEILVEIYKDGKQLTKGITSTGFGKVTLSVDTTTGIAQPPVVSGAATASGTTSSPVATVPVNTTAKTPN